MAVDTTRTAGEILDAEFLEVRARLLDVAAALDRIERSGAQTNDPRLGLLRHAIETLAKNEPHRAESLQKLFSRQYDPHWKASFGITPE